MLNMKKVQLDANNLYGYAISKFLPTCEFKWIDPKQFDLNKYNSNSSKGCFVEVDIEYSKELREIHNDYLLAPDKREIKYQLMIADFHKILICNVKKLVPNFF